MLQAPLSSARTRDSLYASRRSADLSNIPLLVGSGQFDNPWARMQRAKASAEASVPTCVVVVPPCVVVVAALVEATLATRGEPPPPQPAASSDNAATATTAARMSGRRQRTCSVPFGKSKESSPPEPERVGAEAERLLRVP